MDLFVRLSLEIQRIVYDYYIVLWIQESFDHLQATHWIYYRWVMHDLITVQGVRLCPVFGVLEEPSLTKIRLKLRTVQETREPDKEHNIFRRFVSRIDRLGSHHRCRSCSPSRKTRTKNYRKRTHEKHRHIQIEYKS